MPWLNQQFLKFVLTLMCMSVALDSLSNFIGLPFFSCVFCKTVCSNCSLICFILTCFGSNGWIDFNFLLWLIPVSLSSFFDMSWFDPCLCGLSAAFACSSGSLLALDARLGLGGARFFFKSLFREPPRRLLYLLLRLLPP